MAVLRVFLLAYLFFFCESCDFQIAHSSEQLINSNLISKGLVCDGVLLTVDGSQVTGNEFVLGSQVEFEFKNLRAVDESSSEVERTVSIYILKNGIDTVKKFSFPVNRGKNDKGRIDSKIYFTNLMVASGSLDHLACIVFEEDGKDKSLTFKYTFRTIPVVFQEYERKGLYCDYSYLFDRESENIITEQVYSGNGLLTVAIVGLGGLEEEKGITFPQVNVKVMDSNGNILLTTEKHFDLKVDSGVDPKHLKEPFGIDLNLKNKLKTNSIKIIVDIKDQKSEKALSTIFEMTLN